MPFRHPPIHDPHWGVSGLTQMYGWQWRGLPIFFAPLIAAPLKRRHGAGSRDMWKGSVQLYGRSSIQQVGNH